jgi:hypothetical protein
MGAVRSWGSVLAVALAAAALVGASPTCVRSNVDPGQPIPSDPENYIQVGVLGQSNAINPSFDENERDVTSPDPFGRVSLTMWRDRTVHTLADASPVHKQGDKALVSPWPRFAGDLMASEEKAVWLYAGAVSGTCLAGGLAQWAPGGGLYQQAIGNLALMPQLSAVLWLQGECDALAGVDGATYRAALEDLADHVFADLAVPMIVAPIHDFSVCGAPQAAFTAIREATQDAIDAHPYILQGPELNDLALNGTTCTNPHIRQVRALGERWATALAAIL